MKSLHLRRTLAGFGFAAALFSIGPHPAFAARIYNFLAAEARIMPSIDLWDEITLPANPTGYCIDEGCGKSPSLSWIATQVSIQSPGGTFVCGFWWWTHTEITGGNYLTIGQQGRKVICTLCNADHQPVETSYGEIGFIGDPNRYSYVGC
jgi:hypothetical protein